MTANDSPATDTDPAARRPRRRPWLMLGGLVLLLLGALAWEILIHDAPPPDDAHLMPQWSDRGGHANPLAVFYSRISSKNVGLLMSRLSNEAAEARPGTGAELEAFFHSIQPELDAYQALMATDIATWQWPEAPQQALATPSSSSVHIWWMESLAKALRLRVLLLASEGNTEAATRESLLLIRWAHGMKGSELAFNHLFAVSILQSQAADTLDEALTSGPASPALLRHCLQELRGYPDHVPAHLQFADRIQYAKFKDFIPNIPPGDLSSIVYRSKLARQHFPVFLKRNRALALKAAFVTARMEAAAHGLRSSQMQAESQRKTWQMTRTSERKLPLCLINPNFAGMELVLNTEHLAPSSISFALLAQHAIQHRQVLLMLAMRLHELEKGRFPARLEDLVPDYLPAVPEDEFTGTPMRWNPARETLYSVGEDSKDDGGDIFAPIYTAPKDFGSVYWWSKPPAAGTVRGKTAVP